MASIDLNCDMGEGCGNDAELMKYISSANVACGFHAGDPETMRTTVELALESGVAIGAHPGFPDPANFGRRSMQISPMEVFDIVGEQIRALDIICRAAGAVLHHVKPHGALYNQAAKDRELAAVIAESIVKFDPSLILFGLSGSFLISEAKAVGLVTASEIFADRTYQADGSLTSRTESNALIANEEIACAQVLEMIRSKSVTATTGETISITADTVCIHGDGEHAVEFARVIAGKLASAGVQISSPAFSARPSGG
ncbi:MAG: 5-oxoprolinase subunit PxpA [Pyrinomonadaceae bacterium]